PTVLEVFNTLLKHLRMSVDFELGESSRRNSSSSVSSVRGRESDERIVQNAIIQTIGFFGGNLPDYQRAEVTSGFKSKSMSAALPPPFLDPLFSISLMEDSELRQLVLEILHNIIDRHDNRAKLRGIRTGTSASSALLPAAFNGIQLELIRGECGLAGPSLSISLHMERLNARAARWHSYFI
ncbi:membrane anchoring protein efr3a, partial [Xenoophorus captivus]